MKSWLKYPATALVTALIASGAFAQTDNNKEKSKNNRSNDIIIRKKAGNSEKMTIVVEGDNVTINGKSVNDYKGGDVTIIKTDRNTSPRATYYNRATGDRFETLIPTAVNKARLGVMTEKAEDGARITGVTKESGAEKAGLKKDDIITKVGNKKIESPQDLTEAISSYKPNDKVDISYKRDGKENRLTAILGENKASQYSFRLDNDDIHVDIPEGVIPPMENFNFNFGRRPRLGLQIQDVEEGKGVTVKDVDDETPADKAGLKEGDVITKINGKEVNGVDDLRNETKDLKEGDAVKFNFRRGGQEQTVDVKIPKRLRTANL